MLLLLLTLASAWSLTFDTWAERLTPAPHPERAADYRFMAQLYPELAALGARHPDLITPILVGRSVEKRPIWGFRFRHPQIPVEKRVLVFAQLHALEWVGAEVAAAYMTALAEYPPRGLEAYMGGLPPGVEVIVVPIANPDGRRAAERDLVEGRARTYRRGNARKVDLNRDWTVHREATALWRHLLPSYYVTSPDGPLSQPESRALDRLAREGFGGPPPDVVVSLHAFGGYLYYPWGGRFYRVEERAEYERVGALMAEAQKGRPYKVKQLSHWGFLFRIQGAELDHFHEVYGAQSWLIELTRSGIRLRQPSTWRDYFRWYNPVEPTPHVVDGAGALLALTREVGRQAAASAGERDAGGG